MIARRVTHVITGLNPGGAEMMLYKLLGEMDRSRFDPLVVSLLDKGTIGPRIGALGVPVRALGMRRGVPNPLAILKLARWLQQAKPDVIQTWMYHADLIGGLAARLAGDIPVAWGIRHSNLDPQGSKRSTIWTAKTCARLSHWLPIHIVCCSEASRRVHAALGYATHKMTVIPNGFDLNTFKPDYAAQISVRQDLDIPESVVLIGLVGRFDPQKDHRNFIEAAALLYTRTPDVHFVLCGDGVTWENRELLRRIEMAGIREHCHLLGRRGDIPRLMAALDIASSSSSYGEGFSNVVGEAMACGVPCVVTDVGDSAYIVGDTGKVLPPKDPDALAKAWQSLIDLGAAGRAELGRAARARIIQHFSLPTVVRQYEALYSALLDKKRETH